MMTEIEPVPPGVDPTAPSPARLYDYYLGGTSNFPAGRAAAEQLKARVPDLADRAWANRGFHQRAAIWMAARGIRQFNDIGSGLTTQNNTRDAAHQVARDARAVYVGNDPMVAAQAGVLLADAAKTPFVLADLRDPDRVLADPQLCALIGFTEPAGPVMTAVLHLVADSSDPWGGLCGAEDPERADSDGSRAMYCGVGRRA
jgi:hypothetical protein